MPPAVAVKEAVVEAAGTVTEAATGRRGLLLARATMEPPEGADPLNVTTQLVVLELANVVGVQVRLLSVGAALAGPVTTPPLPVSTSVLPVSEEAAIFKTLNDVLTALGATVIFTNATTPLLSVFLFRPDNMQVCIPDAATQLRVFPAATATGPAVADMAITFDAGKANLHCSVPGSSPAGEDTDNGSETVPFAAATPEERTSV